MGTTPHAPPHPHRKAPPQVRTGSGGPAECGRSRIRPPAGRSCRRCGPARRRAGAQEGPGTRTSALVRRGVLLLGVMLELLALLLETVHQIRQTGTDERAPVITVRVVVRTDPLHGVHHSAHVTDDLHDLLTRLG